MELFAPLQQFQLRASYGMGWCSSRRQRQMIIAAMVSRREKHFSNSIHIASAWYVCTPRTAQMLAAKWEIFKLRTDTFSNKAFDPKVEFSADSCNVHFLANGMNENWTLDKVDGGEGGPWGTQTLASIQLPIYYYGDCNRCWWNCLRMITSYIVVELCAQRQSIVLS